MPDLLKHSKNILDDGFTIIEDIYTDAELAAISGKINSVDTANPTFRKSTDLFAIRQFLKEIPEIGQLIFTDSLKTIINSLFGADYFVVKSIYFDKPEQSNWFVAYHQDLTISVDKKVELAGYTSWTNKHNQFAVQPPVNILEDNFTIRIHLDDTDENNGALKVIHGSHLQGIRRVEDVDFPNEDEQICKVNAGGIMIMKPLLFHASNRTTNNKRRRVIHIEFSKAELPKGIQWSERD
ncbi:MAG TPA: phytanoyl-CoA dioxygenase family protein [Mucilaginibacter sp.]|nr:phytanoyl-CoA dioxygenase family protein [Mucilaginibacter sp.]